MPDVRSSGWCPFTLTLLPGASVHETAGSTITIAVGGRQYDLGAATTGLVDALQRLAGPGATEEELRDRLVTLETVAALPALYLSLLELSSRGLLCHGVVDGGRRLLTAVPACKEYRVGSDRADPRSRFVLSRFALIRRDGDQLVLESPRSFARVVVHDARGAALLLALAADRSLAELNAGAAGISQDAARSCVDLLQRLDFVRAVGGTSGCDEDTDDALTGWEFHDLLLHSRSRRGRHQNPYGATYPLRHRMVAMRAIKERPPGVVVPLFRPDIDSLRLTDPPFTTVLEQRRSRRHHGSAPITAQQLGEFLYRACRVRREIPAGVFQEYEATDRVYPSGGAAYPLELYLVVNRCEGLAGGLYYYSPTAHDLTRFSDPTAATNSLLDFAAFAAGSAAPQVLITLAARMQRVTWKYSSIAYATVLKDVGVVFQTMYLVASAMGVAACAIGGGNSDVFARATGLSYYVEPAVGEFILGTMGNEREE